jgi:hypothetical protein
MAEVRPPSSNPPSTPTIVPVPVRGSTRATRGLPLVIGASALARVAGDPDQVPVSGVDAELIGAQHVLDVLAFVRLEHDEADVEVRIRRARPLRRDDQPGGCPDAVGRLAVPVAGDEHDVLAVAAAPAAVDAVRPGDQQVLSRAGHHAGGAEMVAAGVMLEQRPNAQARLGWRFGRRLFRLVPRFPPRRGQHGG